MMKPIDMDKERRIREHLEALAVAIQASPQAAAKAAEILNQEEKMEEERDWIAVRIPKVLVERAEALWDQLIVTPELRASTPRRSGAAAVRLTLLRGLEGLEQGENWRENGR